MGKKSKVGKDRKDKFYQLAKETGFRSRAAFKLIQLNRKFGFLQSSQVCIDLCAAPGGWMQVARQNMPVSSIVIGVDLFPIKPVPGCISLVEDITTDKCRSALTKELKTWKADVVLNDGAPNVGKNWIFDAYQQICLSLSAVRLATEFLRPNGWFITKVFRSKDYNALIWVLKQLFKKVHATKPSASRKESAEIFVVCQYYKAPDKIDPRFFDAKHVFEELDIEPTNKINLLKESKSKKEKKAKAEGYEGTDVRKIIPVSEFIAFENAVAELGNITQIDFDDDKIKNHRLTTNEIVECCRDIKVLGRKDLRDLLKWQKTLHKEFHGEEQEEQAAEGEKPKLSAEDEDEKELEEVEQTIKEMQLEQEKEAKRKKKKANKERNKLTEKLNLKMVIQGDEGPREDGDVMMFSLNNIKSKKEMEGLLDAAPDFTLRRNQSADSEFKPKFVAYSKDTKGGLYDEDNQEDDQESVDSDADLKKTGEMALDDEGSKNGDVSDDEPETPVVRNRNPLITDLDYRDKESKRLSRAQLWFEKESFKDVKQNVREEDFDLDALARDYEKQGVPVSEKAKEKTFVGKKAKKRARHEEEKEESSSDDSDYDVETETDKVYETVEKVGGKDGFEVVAAEPTVKKVKLSAEELALAQMITTSRKTKRDIEDSAWNRYTFNDENLPDWFVKDEENTMKKGIVIPDEIVAEYRKREQDMNVRTIKKVIEAKARKKKRSVKKLDKIKKKAENILENVDNTNQEKIRALKKLYKKQDGKKKEIKYVVATRSQISGKRVRRPKGVEGRFRVVDPRLKKDKRGTDAAKRRSKKKAKAKK